MENFFYSDTFYRDLEDLCDDISLYELTDVEALPDDWTLKVQESTLEKMFVLTDVMVAEAILQYTDRFEERFPEDDNGDCLNKLEKAIPQCIDIYKINEAVSSLYYPNGKFTFITKQEIIEFFK